MGVWANQGANTKHDVHLHTGDEMIFKSEEEKQLENKEFMKCLEDPEFRKHLEEELDRICEADIADAKHIAYCKANNIKYY